MDCLPTSFRHGYLCDNNRITVRRSEIREVITACTPWCPMNLPLGCLKFFFKCMKLMIAKFVQTCQLCHRINPDLSATQGLLQPLPLQIRKWQSIAMYSVFRLTETCSNGMAYDLIITVVHRSKMVHILRTRNNCNAVDDAELLLSNVFKYHVA